VKPVTRDAHGVSTYAAEHSPSERGDEWSAFLGEHAPLILQVVRLFERDADAVQDCFLFVCERLRRDDLRRIRRFREEGTASFPTWLRAVVRRLCLDWRRHRFGRFRLPRAIARLSEFDQEVFRFIHLRRMSENETFHCAKALWPGLTRAHLADAVARVGRSLPRRQWWLLLVHRPRLQSISDAPEEADPADREASLVDPAPDPERDAAEHERTAALRDALERLPPRPRLLLRLRFGQDLGLEQIARIVGLSGAAQAERQIQQALDTLRTIMGAPDEADVSVQEG
jgi:RNA polymerase sigma factor (sigma-70 family)